MATPSVGDRAVEAATGDPSVVLNLSISSDLNANLSRIAADLGTTRALAVVKAIALLDIAARAKREGKAFGVAESADVLLDEIVGL